MKESKITLSHKGKVAEFMIRPCSIKDFSSIMRLQTSVWENLPSNDLFVFTEAEDIKESLEIDFCIGVFFDNELVAFSLMVKNRLSHRNYGYYLGYDPERLLKCVSFDTTFVSPLFRGFGLQRMLTIIRIDEAIRSGASEALATVSPNNLHSLRNLQNAGFEVIDHQVLYQGKERYILRKQIYSIEHLKKTHKKKEETSWNESTGTYLRVDLGTIRHNSGRVVRECAKHGIEVLGVTKGFSAIPIIVRAMIDGGITRLADSRLDNIITLRQLGFKENITLLRIPMISNTQKIVRYTDCSLNSETAAIQALSESAVFLGKKHDIILMIDLGDRREGVLPSDSADVVRHIMKLPGIRLKGIGTNMGCYGGILPTQENLSALSDIADELEHIIGHPIQEISGGGTSSLLPMCNGQMPARVNQLRIGEGILLGTDTTHNCSIPWLKQNAFLLYSEIVEIKDKPSLPEGDTGMDAFGNIPKFEDLGIRKRAIIALGRQDVSPEGILPCDEKIRVLGASSDHTILDITDAARDYKVGDSISFHLKYQGLLHLCGSRYIKKIYI